MPWKMELTEASSADFDGLDGSVKPIVLKALKKVAENPLPLQEGGYGKPLGNKGGNDLSGFYKIKLRKQGIRVVYGLKRTRTTMTVIIISLRSENQVYDQAKQRIRDPSNFDQ